MPDRPLKLYLIRHGQTAWNAARRVLGRTDIPLDEVGLVQAASLGERLGAVDAVWSSPLARARQTAAALRGPAARLLDGLTEMDQGELDGLGETELMATHGPILLAWRTDPAGVRLPGGETMDEVQARGLEALAQVAAGAEGRVAVVTHQIVISATLCALSGESLSRWRSHTHPNCAWTEIEWGPTPRILAEKISP